MLLGVIADDFTGASDIANTLSRGNGRGGLRTIQYLGIPETDAKDDCEAGVVALKSRSIPAADAVAQSLAALRWLQAQGCKKFVFKYCSTFDSTRDGNIGPVIEALGQALGELAIVVCPSFPATGRTVYQGHLFVNDRLLNESGLENHPLNPMTDPDIRRWLGYQTSESIGHIPFQTVAQGHGAIADALAAARQSATRMVVVDAISERNLVDIGRAAVNAKLLTGGSGIALGLPELFMDQGQAGGTASGLPANSGPEAILAGSCSRATLQQIAVHETAHPALKIDVEALLEGRLEPETFIAFIRANRGNEPLVYGSSTPEEIARMQAIFPGRNVGGVIEEFIASIAAEACKAGVRRLVVAGGETSGAVIERLGLKKLYLGPEIDPGVPVLISDGEEPVYLALKSGNFGGRDFFSKALKRMSRQ